MPTTEIERPAWAEFFKRFNRVHNGWLSTMEIVSPTVGLQVEARDLPFASVSADEGPSEPPIRIVFGNATGPHVSHAIETAEHIFLERTAEGADQALEIEGAGVKTRLTFRVPALPETVDGVT